MECGGCTFFGCWSLGQAQREPVVSSGTGRVGDRGERQADGSLLTGIVVLSSIRFVLLAMVFLSLTLRSVETLHLFSPLLVLGTSGASSISP